MNIFRKKYQNILIFVYLINQIYFLDKEVYKWKIIAQEHNQIALWEPLVKWLEDLLLLQSF